MFDRKTISKTVEELARRISQDYPEGNVVFVCILKGAVVFLSDLIRCLDIPVEIDFVRLASYGPQQVSTRDVKITKDIELPIQGKDVLIIEDIVDTGWTLEYLVKKLSDRQPKSIRVCALLNKEARREVEVQVDYVGFEVGNRFVVGYGIDFNEKYRNLPEIYCVGEGPKK